MNQKYEMLFRGGDEARDEFYDAVDDQYKALDKERREFDRKQ